MNKSSTMKDFSSTYDVNLGQKKLQMGYLQIRQNCGSNISWFYSILPNQIYYKFSLK